MFQIILSALISALKGKIGEALIQFIFDYVEMLMSTQLSGTEKKAKLTAALSSVGGAVSEQFASASGWLVNLAIEAIVAKLKK